MPLFYFHSQTDRRCTDTEGSELADLGAARTEAGLFFGELVRGALARTAPVRRWGVTVTDEQGLVLHELSMDPVLQAVPA